MENARWKIKVYTIKLNPPRWVRNLIVYLALPVGVLIGASVVVRAGVTLTMFSTGDPIKAKDVNDNFATLKSSVDELNANFANLNDAVTQQQQSAASIPPSPTVYYAEATMGVTAPSDSTWVDIPGLSLSFSAPENTTAEFADLVEEGLSEKTRKNIRATLRRILASAVEWDLLPAIPQLPRIKVPEASFDFFSQEESEALLAAAHDEEERLLLLFALHTGVQVSEQLAVQWSDIDWRSRKLIVSASDDSRNRGADQERTRAEDPAHGRARDGATTAPASARVARVLQSGRLLSHRLVLLGSARHRVQVCGSAPDPLARVAAFVCIAARLGGSFRCAKCRTGSVI